MKFLKALSIFAGTIIGVGIFGLPYVALKAGFFTVFLYFIFITAIAIAIHLMYGEVSLGTEKIHRLPGAVGIYMGNKWKKFAFLLTGLGLSGALLAYLIVGGKFLNSILFPYFGGSAVIYTIIFFIPCAFLIFRGIKSISMIELVLLFVFFFILFIFFIKSKDFINIDYLKGVDAVFFTLPYGIVLFSLWGSNMVPEVKEILGGDRKLLKLVVISGILLAALTYLFFIFIILGASGQATSKEAISGLSFILGDGVIRLGFIFGIITCFTSFLTLGLTLKKILWHDFGVSPHISWFAACFFPFFLFLGGAREFIEVISLTGAMAVGGMGVMIFLLYKEFLKKKFSRRMSPVLYALPIFFIAGVLFEVFYFFVR